MEIAGIKEFKLPGIEDKNVTKEEYNELMRKLGVVSFQLQEINDTLDGRILSANIHNESIQTRHLVAESITTAKLAAGEIVLATIAEDFNWSTLVDDGNKPDDNADVTGDNTAADIINLPATPSVAGLYASGTYLGYHDGSNWKAYIQNDGKFYFTGDANNYVQWNGISLAIKGTITLLNTIDWQTNVAGTGKPDDNADVTLAAIQGELSLAGGGLVLASAGAKIRGGQTAYATGTGFWLGDDSGTFKFSIGSSTIYMRWTGAALEIKGIVSADALSALNADLGVITAGNITLDTSGFIRTTGKDNYADTTAGIFLGYDTDAYKINIGDATHYIKWDGAKLIIGSSSGVNNLAFGGGALNSLTTGYSNTALGYQTLYNCTEGHDNLALGYQALYTNIVGNLNVSLGYQSLYLSTGDDNIAVGVEVLYNNTGNRNTGVGSRSLKGTTSGFDNVGMGNAALFFNTEGDNNVALGSGTLYKNTLGDKNTGIGMWAGHENEEGNENVFIGYSAGFYETGSDKLYIDSSNTTTPLIYGEFDNLVEVHGNLGIGTRVFGTSATRTLAMLNGTVPSTSPANAIQLYAEDVSASSELKVRDEGTTVTTLSPHNFELFKPDKNDPLPWSYHSVNHLIGKKVNADISGALRELERLSGKKFLYYEDVDKISSKKYLEDKKRQLIANYIAEKKIKPTEEEAEKAIEEELMIPDWIEDRL